MSTWPTQATSLRYHSRSAATKASSSRHCSATRPSANASAQRGSRAQTAFCRGLRATDSEHDGLVGEVVVERQRRAVVVDDPLQELLVHRVLLVADERLLVGELHVQQVLIAAGP